MENYAHYFGRRKQKIGRKSLEAMFLLYLDNASCIKLKVLLQQRVFQKM